MSNSYKHKENICISHLVWKYYNILYILIPQTTKQNISTLSYNDRRLFASNHNTSDYAVIKAKKNIAVYLIWWENLQGPIHFTSTTLTSSYWTFEAYDQVPFQSMTKDDILDVKGFTLKTQTWRQITEEKKFKCSLSSQTESIYNALLPIELTTSIAFQHDLLSHE